MIAHILLTVLRIIGYILLALLALIVLVLLLPAGARIAYDGGDLKVWARLGPVKLPVFPKKEPEEEQPPKEKNKPKRGKKPKKQKEAEPTEEGETEKKKKFSVSREQIFYTLDKLPPILGKALRGIGRGIRFDPMKVHILIAGADPADTAQLYGRLYAALSALVPALERTAFVKHQDVRLYVDFQEASPDCIADVGVSIRPGVLVLVALRAGFGVLKWFLGFRKLAKPDEGGTGPEQDKRNPDHTDTKEAA